MSKGGVSGREVGEQYLAQVQRVLQAGGPLPTRNGDIDVTALASAAGVPRQSLYKNAAIRGLLEEVRKKLPAEAGVEQEAARAEVSTASVTSADLTKAKEMQLERKVHRLEQQNAALVAENYELRRERDRLRLQIGRQDMTIETGRRVVAPE